MLGAQDIAAVRMALANDPIACCMVAARVETAGIDRWRLGGELWGRDVGSTRLDALCFAGAHLIPLLGDRAALRLFADRALQRKRQCSSLVGPVDLVLGLWQELELSWAPAREVCPEQPLLAMGSVPTVPIDPLVRPVRQDEVSRYLPAAIAMFTEEVGIDPLAGDGGVGYRARVTELIAAGRAFARFEHGEVVFKAEIGAMSSTVGQIQGVWVHPERRGHGLGVSGTATVVEHVVRRLDRTASLYVNAHNTIARATYRSVGFREVGTYATVLF